MGILDKLAIMIAGKDEQNDSPPPENLNLRKVFIVESDPVLKGELQILLPADQYEVVTADNGAEALNTLLSYKPEAILLDLDLPIMHGRDLIHHIRAIPEYKNTPIMVISEKGDVDTIRFMKQYEGAKSFLVKSTVTPEEIIYTFQNIM